MKLFMLSVCTLLFHLDVTRGSSSSLHECCQMVEDNTHCKQVCQQMLSTDASDMGKHLNNLPNHCPITKVDFWICVNQTISVSGASHWFGRSCCELSLVSQCRNVCQRARSRNDITAACRPGDEVAVYTCLDKHEESQRCCQTVSSQCRAICRTIFIQDSAPTQTQIQTAAGVCEQPVTVCMHNHTRAVQARNPTDNLPCCDHTDSDECRKHCRSALSLLASEVEIVDQVSLHCGLPNPSTRLWQCFLQSSTNGNRQSYNGGGSMEVTGIDGAKLQCCGKAVTSKCRDLCKRTYSKGWTDNVSEFHQQCSNYNNMNERNLNMCLDDVEDRCQLGCNGLNFCTNFNYRPTELFRTCTTEADDGARNALNLWRKGSISMPILIGYDIPVKDITQCQPRKWKAIACTLQIKPCHSQGHANFICKSDCIDILSECLDMSRVDHDVTPESICNRLSPPDESALCISLAPYLVDSPYQPEHRQLTTPCNPNPCSSNQICTVNRRNCSASSSASLARRGCPQFICKPGCSMGEVVTQLVPFGTYVRIPMASPLPDGRTECYNMCKCGPQNRLNPCFRYMGCIKDEPKQKQCLLKSGMIHYHTNKFQIGCNRCVCFAGEMMCTVRQCISQRSSEELGKYTGMPCNCPRHYQPVCGLNGQTYQSFCVAECNGIPTSELVLGTCVSKDPCHSNPCASPDRCIKRPQVCLGRRLGPGECKQYECVRLTEACDKHSQGHVCDVDGEEFPSICQLLVKRKTLAYRGHCRTGCRRNGGRVCAVNGETYSNECSAWAAGLPVDYDGVCQAVGQHLNHQSLESSCPNVTCRALPHLSICQAIRPPGACCPMCAGEMRMLISQRLVDEVRKEGQRPPLSIYEILDVLRLQISVTECDVFAYPSLEGDLVVLVMPVTAAPTKLQIEACMRETEKLGSLITSNSPIVTTFVAIHVIAAAEIRTSSVSPVPAFVRTGSNASAPMHLCVSYRTFLFLVLLGFTDILHRIFGHR